MKYHVLLEFDPESSHCTGTVVEIPDIVVDAKREADAIRLAREAIEFYFEESGKDSAKPDAAVHAKVVTVEV
jgi:predicted RNase H-like HicB family nuclease